MLKSSVYRLLRRALRGKDAQRYYALIKTRPARELNSEFLAALLAFCRERNAYYRKLLAGRLISADVLPELPILTKEKVRLHFEELKSEGAGRKTHLNSSGGSTGLPQTFVQDEEYGNWAAACETYYFQEFHGVEPLKVRKVVLWGSDRDTLKQRDIGAKVTNWLTGTVFLNTFQVNEDDWRNYIEIINRSRPYFIKGYAGSLFEIARVIRKHNLKVHTPRFLYSSAEMLRGFMRREIEQAFGAKVYDFYGSREVGPIAGECREGRRHIFTFNNHVEVVDDEGAAVKDGEPGRLLITNLHNYSMPLLRYEIGDTGSMSRSPCPCGNPLPYLAEIHGRITDHFKRPDGALVHGEFFTHLFYYRPWVTEFQVNQLALDHVQIAVVKGSEPPAADLADIEAKVRHVMGPDCRVTWEFVPAIARTAQGKHRFTVSHLP
jgi:phenylacetate-CoA ligase